MTRPLTPEEEAMVRGCDEQDFASDSEPMRLWATLDAEREKVKVLREALEHARNQIRHPDQMIEAALATTEPKP